MEIGRQQIRDYLLGKLPQTDTEEIDLQMISDEGLEEAFVHAEDELIEDYLEETLSPDDAQLFRENFLVSDERKEQVRYIHTLREYARKKVKEEGAENLSRDPKESLFTKLGSVLRYFLHPVPASFAIIILILFGVLGWRFFFTGSDRRDLTLLEKEFAELNDQNLSDLTGFQTFSVINLVPGTFRDSDKVNRLYADQLTDRVLFRLGLPSGTPPDQIYTASLVKEGIEVFRLDHAASYKNQSGIELRLILPSSMLTKGDYVINIKGKNTDDPALGFPFSVR